MASDIPEGYTFIKELSLRGRNGIRKVHQIRNNETGKYTTLEDLKTTETASNTPKIDFRNYRQEKLTGKEPGFDQWALSLQPETDHFPDLSHGLNNPREYLQIMNREFESLPNGSRIDLGEIFSSDSSTNLLQYAYKNRNRIKLILPNNLNETVRSNAHGTRGRESADLFNKQLDRLLDYYDYPYDIVPRAVYDEASNTLIQPKLSFIKLHKKGNKITINGNNI